MTEHGFSWASALEEGTLTELQLETLQSMLDNGEAPNLLEAARLLDYEETHKAGEEPGRLAH